MLDVIERRKQERFKIEGDAYVYSALSFTFTGKVIDISRSGMSFSRMESDDSEPIKIDDLGILISRKNFIAENLPLQIVSDKAIPDLPVSVVVRKRCGGCFVSLTPEQKGVLECFIQRHAKQDTKIIKNSGQ